LATSSIDEQSRIFLSIVFGLLATSLSAYLLRPALWKRDSAAAFGARLRFDYRCFSLFRRLCNISSALRYLRSAALPNLLHGAQMLLFGDWRAHGTVFASPPFFAAAASASTTSGTLASSVSFG
jgi:hypothetical protein